MFSCISCFINLRLIPRLQALLEEQQRLVPLEQTARQRVVELSSIMESEKNQGSVLKAILQAKEANLIPGIYGRMGDLGAIDGDHSLSDSTVVVLHLEEIIFCDLLGILQCYSVHLILLSLVFILGSFCLGHSTLASLIHAFLIISILVLPNFIGF